MATCYRVCLVVVAALFIFANRSTGIWVRVSYEDVLEANIFTLTTWSTVNDFWRCGAHEIALTTGITTGALPYALLAALFCAWPYRHSLLAAILLQLVRLEHMLTMAAILLCVAFEADFGSHLRVRTVFGWGTFAFEIANACSYLLALVFCRACGDHASCGGEGPARCLPLVTTSLSSRDKRRGNRTRRIVVGFLCALNACVLVPSLFVPSIGFTFRELASEFVRERSRRMSVVDVVFSIAGATERLEAKAAWTAWLASICVALPVLSAFAVAAMLTATNLSAESSTRIFATVVHLHAISSLDVLFVVIANVALNVGTISDWIVNGQDKAICEHAIKRGCAVVTGQTLPGFYWLILHAILNNSLHFFLYAVVYKHTLHACIAKYVPDYGSSPRTTRDDLTRGVDHVSGGMYLPPSPDPPNDEKNDDVINPLVGGGGR